MSHPGFLKCMFFILKEKAARRANAPPWPVLLLFPF
jgi:hypothetical protein